MHLTITFAWVIYEIIVLIWTEFLSRELSPWEKMVLVALGIGVAIYGGHSEYQDSLQMSALNSTVKQMAQKLDHTSAELANSQNKLKDATDKLANGQAYNTGQLSALGQMSSETLEMLANKSNANSSAGAEAVASAAVARITQLEHRVYHLLEPRHLTEEQRNLMRPILAAHPGQFDISWARNSEAGGYAKEWIDFLTSPAVKWKLMYRSEMPEQNDPSQEIHGVFLGVKDKDNASPNAATLDDAMKAANIKFGIADKSAMVPNNPWLLIGEKDSSS